MADRYVGAKPADRDAAVPQGIGGIANGVTELTARAKAGTLTLQDIEGATFTVTNLSALGVDWFTPLLNPPPCALLGVGRMRHAPAAVGREIHLRDIATFVLTFDHRALAGAPAGRFLASAYPLRKTRCRRIATR